MPDAVVRPLAEADIEAAAGVLTRAFFDYPVWRWLLPDAGRRRELLPDYMRVQARYGVLGGHAYVAGDPVAAVAIWEAPDDGDLDPDGTRTGYAALRRRFDDTMVARTDAMMAAQRPVRSCVMGSATYWCLPWLAVDPPAQRRGLGRALLRDMFARLDDLNAACCHSRPSSRPTSPTTSATASASSTTAASRPTARPSGRSAALRRRDVERGGRRPAAPRRRVRRRLRDAIARVRRLSAVALR